MMTGPQADFWFPVRPSSFVYTGQFYSENTPMGILAWRGQVVEKAPGQAQRLMGNIGARSALGGYVRITTGTDTSSWPADRFACILSTVS